jgi:hypothetical protein
LEAYAAKAHEYAAREGSEWYAGRAAAFGDALTLVQAVGRARDDLARETDAAPPDAAL